jgi:hypothetical protein
MDIINGFKSLIKENQIEISDYVREYNKFQKELKDISLKRGVIERLKIEKIVKE